MNDNQDALDPSMRQKPKYTKIVGEAARDLLYLEKLISDDHLSDISILRAVLAFTQDLNAKVIDEAHRITSQPVLFPI